MKGQLAQLEKNTISAYLLFAWMKAALKCPLTVTEVSKVIEASILSKADI